jgi:tetratricopeptide (TPR) repeat protein
VWQFEELEPTSEDDITIALVTPAAWEWVLTERDNVTRNPNDGEAWGRLGKACKNAITQRKSLRDDPGGLALYAEADRAYARALELLPNDSLWHTGYADLLWQEWYWTVFWSDPTDVALLHKAVSLLARSLELDPKNQKSKDLLDEIGYSVPEYVLHVGDAVDLLILTATPVHVTRTPWSSPTPLPTKTKWPTSVLPPTYTPMAEATEEPTSTASATPAPPTPTTAATTVEPAAVSEPTPAKSGGIPFCGGAVILPLAMGLVLLLKQRKDTRHLHYKERSG